MNGGFADWYLKVSSALKDEPTRGYIAVANNTLQYAMQRDAGNDHPLYASGDGAFYSQMALPCAGQLP